MRHSADALYVRNQKVRNPHTQREYMNNPTPQKLWTQIEAELTCGDCKTARFLIWEKDKYAGSVGASPPQHSVGTEEFLYAVHCDYFKRRVESPDLLKRCGAHQKKGETG